MQAWSLTYLVKRHFTVVARPYIRVSRSRRSYRKYVLRNGNQCCYWTNL